MRKHTKQCQLQHTMITPAAHSALWQGDQLCCQLAGEPWGFTGARVPTCQQERALPRAAHGAADVQQHPLHGTAKHDLTAANSFFTSI